MRNLPALVDGPLSWTLPFSDRSAVLLVQELLGTSSPGGSVGSDSLALDPPLLVWTACRAWQEEGLRPRSIDRLLAWFRAHAPQLLLWPQGPPVYDRSPSADETEKLGRQVVADLAVAELAASQATGKGEEQVEEARLLGILSGARAWLETASPGSDPDAILPAWLVPSDSPSANSHVAQAVHAVRSQQDQAERDLDIRARLEWAEQQARAWAAEVATVPSLLSPLIARLNRLAALEQRFTETLEAEKLESLAEFAAGAGHEINNPLAIIGGRSQLLLHDEESPERQRELALIIAQVRRAHEMIADMRLFSRPPEPEPEALDLTELVNQTMAEFAEQAAGRAIELVRTGEVAPVEIEADRVQLAVVFHAVVRNALEAVGRDGVVEICVRRTPSGAEVSVADDGPGILPEERRHIFDPFYSARQAGRGLGFGLSKAWRIVTNHGGKILVESEPGEGAVFVVRLPRRIVERKRPS
ncbi:MAG: HAMP domain-containing histidine kinase [Planctomycetaceae bacterium]|nr:HAMP domain-containing histidine kinase [Planctomycetaceae bacterium]